jgi:Skp family chaperone for outer membrane proteins
MLKRSLALAGLILLTLNFTPLAIRAQQATASNFAVIEYERVVQSSLAFQSIQQQLLALHDRIQAEINAEEAALVKIDRELAMQQSILAPEVFQEKQRQLNMRVDAARERVAGLNQRIERSRQGATGQIQQALFAIILELVTQRGYNAVLPTSAMVYAAPSLNISDEVQRELDARLPRVEVQFSEQ